MCELLHTIVYCQSWLSIIVVIVVVVASHLLRVVSWAPVGPDAALASTSSSLPALLLTFSRLVSASFSTSSSALWASSSIFASASATSFLILAATSLSLLSSCCALFPWAPLPPVQRYRHRHHHRRRHHHHRHHHHRR